VHCRTRESEATMWRQHEPKLCSAWIPRSRTQRLTVNKVHRQGTSNARAGRRAEMIEQRCERDCLNDTPQRRV
jgi:hypothetical protein